ncbi:hypothetical protein KCMC57_up46690 [Kitasatospora sp. CMC57]|uniref:Uncharacterized protein n=1 Tax=Kitasatospora sp. CMC57 TaxID=3231513 RepID=A0AB33K210_9ACTN
METAALVREARRAGTTVARLRELAAEEPEVARAVAGRTGLTAALAEELAVRWAGDRAGVGVLRALAAQPATGAEWLALLAVHPDELVRRAVAVHRATPEPTVRALAADSADGVRRAVAARDRLPCRMAPVLLHDPAAGVRLVRRPGADPDHLRALTTGPDPVVHGAVVSGGSPDDAGLVDPSPSVRRSAVAEHPFEELAPHLLRLVDDPDPGVRELAATMWRNHDPAALARSAADPEPDVRIGAAGNWYTPGEALVALAADPDLLVPAALAENRYAPPAALAALAEAARTGFGGRADRTADGDERLARQIVRSLLEHPATAPESLRALYTTDPPYFHRGHATLQANWPADLAVGFALDHAARTLEGEAELSCLAAVRQLHARGEHVAALAAMALGPVHHLRAAVGNRHTPSEALAEFARTADPELDSVHLEGLARNPAAPVELLTTWAVAGRYHYELLENLQLPTALLALIAAAEDEQLADQAAAMAEVRALRAGTPYPC